jgi:hypothetical protein
LLQEGLNAFLWISLCPPPAPAPSTEEGSTRELSRTSHSLISQMTCLNAPHILRYTYISSIVDTPQKLQL